MGICVCKNNVCENVLPNDQITSPEAGQAGRMAAGREDEELLLLSEADGTLLLQTGTYKIQFNVRQKCW